MCDHEVIDVELMGLTVDGLTVEQIKKLKAFYQNTTHDVDLERIDFYVKKL